MPVTRYQFTLHLSRVASRAEYPRWDRSFAARNVLGEADDDYKKYFNYFSNERYFPLPSALGRMFGKTVYFSLSNGWAKFYQVDKLRSHEGGGKEF